MTRKFLKTKKVESQCIDFLLPVNIIAVILMRSLKK